MYVSVLKFNNTFKKHFLQDCKLAFEHCIIWYALHIPTYISFKLVKSTGYKKKVHLQPNSTLT